MNRVMSSAHIIFILMGALTVGTYGCSGKWLQSDGESHTGPSTGTQGSSNGNFPAMSKQNPTSELSGFSKNPSEERLSQSGFAISKSLSDSALQRGGDLSADERATQQAGMEDVFFGYDQWNLSETGMQALNHDSDWFKQHPEAKIQIEGHCDERGTADYNVVLGEKRAKATRAYLIELGVSAKQLTTVSYGKERPFCLYHSEPCYQQNRRGHILVRAKQ